MMRLLVVTVVDTEFGGGTVTRVFEKSPVTIGNTAESMLQLVDDRLSAQQGMLFFTGGSVKYMDFTDAAGPGGVSKVANLSSPATSVRVGRFEVSARVEVAPAPAGDPLDRGPPAPRGPGSSVVDVVNAIVSVARAIPRSDHDLMLGFALRAVKLIDLISAVLIELRPAHDTTPPRTGVPSVLRCSCDPLEIADYLLDPRGSDLRLDELKACFVDFVRGEARRLPLGGLDLGERLSARPA